MNVMVLGAGAVGCWIGANLMRAGHHVILVGRLKFVEAVQTDGLHVHLPNGDHWQIAEVDAVASVTDAMPHGAFDVVIVCVKAYSADEAIRELQAATAQSTFVTFQNGVGSEEKFAQIFGAEHVIAATLTSPISTDAPNVIRLEQAGGGVGLARLQEDTSHFEEIGAGFAAAPLLQSTVYPDYRAMKWSKLFLNIVGNATSAILDLSVADIYADPKLFAVEMRMLRETLAVMRAQGIRVINLPGYPAASLARIVNMLPNRLLQPLLKNRIARGRGDKPPSFYYDVANHTGKSEVEYLNGAVAQAGRQLGVSTPVNEALMRMLMETVSGRSTLSHQQMKDQLEAMA